MVGFVVAGVAGAGALVVEDGKALAVFVGIGADGLDPDGLELVAVGAAGVGAGASSSALTMWR